MGSIITLRLGNLELDWAKNWRGTDHGELFQSGDFAKVAYHYVDEDGQRILRLLALNQKNLGLQVAWRFAELLEGGWVARDEIVRELPRSNRFLIVTEGSSDAKILAHALKLLRPSVADFFYFVDMEE